MQPTNQTNPLASESKLSNLQRRSKYTAPYKIDLDRIRHPERRGSGESFIHRRQAVYDGEHLIEPKNIEVPDDVKDALHINGVVDYNTAQSLNLEQLFDLLTETDTWKK